MSFILDVLEDLWNIQLHYKGVRVNMFGVPQSFKNKENSYRSTLSRLHKNGLISKKSENWILTNKGKEYLNTKKVLCKFDSNFKSNAPKNLLLIFDVPESRKSERRWLRLHLKKFKYFMIQKSAWVGPSPLPREFVSYLKEIKLDSCIKRFRLASPYKIHK